MNRENSSIALILLAAGNASRMGGQQKQLLPFGEKGSLLGHAAQVALQSKCRPVLVVLAANAARTSEELRGLDVQILVNENWSKGVGSSIALAIGRLQEAAAQAVVIALADQPLVTHVLLDKLVEAHLTTGAEIVASRYGETVGAPALFNRNLFTELRGLAGDEGAKRVIKRHLEKTRLIDAPEAVFDVDTQQDYERLCAEAFS